MIKAKIKIKQRIFSNKITKLNFKKIFNKKIRLIPNKTSYRKINIISLAF